MYIHLVFSKRHRGISRFPSFLVNALSSTRRRLIRHPVVWLLRVCVRMKYICTFIMRFSHNNLRPLSYLIILQSDKMSAIFRYDTYMLVLLVRLGQVRLQLRAGFGFYNRIFRFVEQPVKQQLIEHLYIQVHQIFNIFKQVSYIQNAVYYLN